MLDDVKVCGHNACDDFRMLYKLVLLVQQELIISMALVVGLTTKPTLCKKITFLFINIIVLLTGLLWLSYGSYMLHRVESRNVAFGTVVAIGILYVIVTIGGFLAFFKNKKILFYIYSILLLALVLWQVIFGLFSLESTLLVFIVLLPLTVIKILGVVFGFQLANEIVSLPPHLTYAQLPSESASACDSHK
ncbi:unnamed protein product [Rodentolepis nana]|uniref:Sugar transporter SWEET1 n=1 Tax=Rodentolepis nana TaxID=102285 RepID=A0A0R3TRV1_RODNA|nr:unnamed protein product [Rodentolepis nana]